MTFFQSYFSVFITVLKELKPDQTKKANLYFLSGITSSKKAHFTLVK